ncbi:putative transcriptional regulator [Mycetocola sp. BIGb0189]|uniref:hypothetical protein n=1 Tax=Mycetocola sp. BIGb0189 TaxID=2940604 RepID=UPI002169E949|nr:hypothetical protein [Mycetocola sp. BIGb0189]MCS4277911.1 putative transcriptional regulator [Mycetocola sp. BIGb0189]
MTADETPIVFDRMAYPVKEFARVCGLGETTIREHIAAGNLIVSYPNTKAIITTVEGQRWLDSLPTERGAA